MRQIVFHVVEPAGRDGDFVQIGVVLAAQNIVLPYEEFDCFQKTVYNHAGELSPKEVAELKRRAYWLFYLHPRRFLHTILGVLAPKGLGRLLLKARRV